MAISILQIPPRVHFIKNGLPFECDSDNVYETQGEFAITEISYNLLSYHTPVDANINVKFSSYDFNIIAKTNPDDSGYQFKAGPHSYPHIENLYLALINNPILVQYYDIIYIYLEIKVILKAKNKGTEYNLDVTITEWVPWTINENDGVDGVIRENFYILSKAFTVDKLDNNPFYSQKGEDKIKPDAVNKIIFDPADYFASLFDYSFSWPIENILTKVDNAIVKYIVAFSEGYGFPLVERKLNFSSDFFALNGKIPEEKLLELNSLNTNWFDNLKFNKEFITCSPYEKLTSKTSPEKLWFLAYDNFTPNPASEQKFQIKVNIKFTDGTNDDYFPVDNNSQQFNMYEVFELNCGYAALNIQNFINTEHEGKIAQSYSFQLFMNGTAISEEKKFTIDFRNHLYERIFIFKNPLGFYETLRLTGKAVISNIVERQQYINNAPNPFEINARNKFSRTLSKQQSFQISSGYFFDLYNAMYAIDAFDSDDIYEIVNNNAIPIIIKTDDIAIAKDGDKKYSFAFEYEFAFNSAIFPAQPDNPAGDFNYDYNLDFY